MSTNGKTRKEKRKRVKEEFSKKWKKKKNMDEWD
jgi:hypothetical protein